jgi:hypothetical protein
VAYLDRLRKTEDTVSVTDAAADYAGQFRQHPIKKILGGLLSMVVGAPPAAGNEIAADLPQNPQAES